MLNEVTIELSKSIKYANGSGGEIECAHVTMQEPTGKHAHICADIEMLVRSAIFKIRDELSTEEMEGAEEKASEVQKEGSNEEGAVVKDPEEMLTLLYSAGADMSKLTLHCRELFKHTVLMGGEKAITSPRMDDLAVKDLRKMVGTYIANFITL